MRAGTGAAGSAPRSNRADASVFRPNRRLVARTLVGRNQALSRAMRVVAPDTSDGAPPMTPATAMARSRSAMTSIVSSSVRSTPSRVVSRSLGAGAPHTDFRTRQPRQIEGVHADGPISSIT